MEEGERERRRESLEGEVGVVEEVVEEEHGAEALCVDDFVPGLGSQRSEEGGGKERGTVLKAASLTRKEDHMVRSLEMVREGGRELRGGSYELRVRALNALLVPVRMESVE